MKITVLLSMALLSSGCVTVQGSKSLVIPTNGMSDVAVTCNSQAKCYDFLGVMWCKLTMNLSQ